MQFFFISASYILYYYQISLFFIFLLLFFIFYPQMFDKSPSEICSKIFNSLSFTKLFSGKKGFSTCKDIDHVVYKLDTISCKTEWTLKDFGSSSRLLSYDGPIQLIGKQFCNSKLPNVAWELCMEIKKSDWRDKGLLSIWLRQIGPNGINNLVNTRYKIYAINYKKERIDIARSSNKFENQAKLGYSTFNLNTYYLGKLLDLDDKLCLHCEVEIDYYKSDENIKNNNRKMFDEDIFTDCVIKVDKKVIKVHRSILATNSEVFLSMLKHKNASTEAENCEVIISDFSFECVQAMLEFFYTGGIEKHTFEANVDELFMIAHKYKVNQLVYECEDFMSNLIDSQNLLKFFKIVDLYEAPILEKKCKNYIQVNKESFLKSKMWEEIQSTCPELSFRILESAFRDF